MRDSSISSLVTVLVWCRWCAAIQVPVSWEHLAVPDSPTPPLFRELTPEASRRETFESLEDERPLLRTNEKPIPVEYFEYPSNKPQFAVDVATFHGVPSPSRQFRATPVQPLTHRAPLALGHRDIVAGDRPYFDSFQTFLNSHDGLARYLGPSSSNYEVFHPYKAEEPNLKNHYTDPHLEKVRNDVEENKKRLQKYEKDAGKANIEKDDYSKTPEQTDEELFGESYKASDFERYRPEKRPHYYTPPPKQRLPHDYLNRKLKYPLNQNYIKIKPVHYQPLRNHLKRLRHQQEHKYGDERNEYPQLGPRHKQHFAEPPDGYDIYERGKKHFDDYQQDVDSAINKYTQDYGAPSYGQDESSDLVKTGNYEKEPQNDSEEDDFVPIKMYAQVRKTESIKHLPKEAAFDEAETPEEILNAPRLREAVKSTKAQTIYSEEGYEDKAYDHEGQQKHASNHEGHGGYLKEKENSGGRYKIPFVAHDFEEGDGVAAGNSYSHKEKYENEDGQMEEQNDSEISTANENENDEDEYDLHGAGSEKLNSKNLEKVQIPETLLSLTKNSEKTTISDENHGTSIKTETEHMTASNKDVDNVATIKHHGTKKNPSSSFKASRRKRNVNFEVPKLNLDNTYLSESEIISISKQKLAPVVNKLKIKYPYYFQNNINKNSPLKYAENLRHIPKKTKGGTEFYDSRSAFECPDVEPEIDPVPEHLNNPMKDETSDGDDVESKEDTIINEERNTENPIRRKRQTDFSTIKKSPRLRGLGDKIDCFKEKYFGDNPLDSPFFVEETIGNPEPLTEINSDVFKISKAKEELVLAQSQLNEIILNENMMYSNPRDNFVDNNTTNSTENEDIKLKPETESVMFKEILSEYPIIYDSDVYSDIIHNIRSSLNQDSNESKDKIIPFLLSGSKKKDKLEYEVNKKFDVFLNKEDITIRSPAVRVKRSSQFIYEPYKVIREHQDHDSKKTTTSGNVSPLIKQLQASKVVDHAIRPKDEIKTHSKVQPVKRNVKDRNYKNIHKEDRAKRKEADEVKDFVDVSFDGRRGEPRYELTRTNHKSKYTPVTNVRSLSLEEYKSRSNPNDQSNYKPEEESHENISKPVSEDNVSTEEIESDTQSPTAYFDVSSYLSKTRPLAKIPLDNINKPVRRQYSTLLSNKDSINLEASSSEILSETLTTKAPPKIRLRPTSKSEVADSEDNAEYDEYEDEPLTTTTTIKPFKIRRKIKIRTTTTTPAPAPSPVHDYDYAEEEEVITTTTPKQNIKIVRRLRKPVTENESNHTQENISTDTVPTKSKKLSRKPHNNPKISEKTLKTQKSTTVTDSKSYGRDEAEDMQKDQIDAMIGGRENLKEFIEDYDETISTENGGEADDLVQNERRNTNSEGVAHRDSEEEEDAEEEQEDDDEDDEEEDDDEKKIASGGERASGEQTGERRLHIQHARAEPERTTEIILPVVRKRIQTNNRPSEPEAPPPPTPARTGQYRRPVQEKSASRAPPSRLEPLRTYRDKSLAEDVNRLAERGGGSERSGLHSDVEVFKQDIQTKKGPRHGGNYRSEKIVEDLDERAADRSPPRALHGGNLKAAAGERAEKPARGSAALLNTLAQAATVLTTTPKFILDPSKRMYYYVDS